MCMEAVPLTKTSSNFLNVPHKSNPHVEASTSSTPVSTNMSNTTDADYERERSWILPRSKPSDWSLDAWVPCLHLSRRPIKGRDAHVYGKRGRPPLKRGYHVFHDMSKTSKPGGPPRKWVPVSYMIIDTHACGNLVGFMHIAPETPQSEMALHPNKSKRYSAITAPHAERTTNQSAAHTNNMQQPGSGKWIQDKLRWVPPRWSRLLQ